MSVLRTIGPLVFFGPDFIVLTLVCMERKCVFRFQPRCVIHELECEKTGLQGVRPGQTQIGLCSQRRLEA